MSGLIVFIDSLRFDAPLRACLEVLGLESRASVPPLGYSSNILPLLFRGRTPDELGFFNEFGLSSSNRAPFMARLDRPTEEIGRIPILRKIVYRGLGLTGVKLANMPLRMTPYFEMHSRSVYARDAKHPSLFEALGFHVVAGTLRPERPPRRDPAALAAAEQALVHHERVFVALGDLDSVSHEAGLDSAPYRQHLDLLAEGVARLVQRFRELHGHDAPVAVLSDHGMATVHATVHLDVEARLGAVGRASYLYFTDATMVRFWCFTDAARAAVDELLGTINRLGRTITADERTRWGMVDAEVGSGDRLFVLHEGLIFEPNFIGRGVPLAMHGYHPEHASQHGVFLTSRPQHLPHGSSSVDMKSVHEILHRTFQP